MKRSRTIPDPRAMSWLISPRLTVVCLAFLMVLTFWGTVYQVRHGLYAAQEMFYNSWFFMAWGFLPFPGTQLVLAVLLVNLVGYLLRSLLTERIKPGILLVHLGLLLLLVGGAVTHYLAEESQLTLEEGASANVAVAYHEWELAVWKETDARRSVIAVDADGLRPGDEITFPGLPWTVAVEQFYRNARAFQMKDGSTPEGLVSGLGISSLQPAPLEKEPERNTAAGVFVVAAPGQDAARLRVLLFGEEVCPRALDVGDVKYHLALRRTRHPLPIHVRLLDFQREMHPGTEMARRFSSLVEVDADGIRREVTISMNKPLRHRGFTLYQSSYSETPDGRQSSTFAVARNYGRLIPYVATGIMVLGMVVHFLAMMMERAKRESSA
jgi:hypothetical protein